MMRSAVLCLLLSLTIQGLLAQTTTSVDTTRDEAPMSTTMSQDIESVPTSMDSTTAGTTGTTTAGTIGTTGTNTTGTAGVTETTTAAPSTTSKQISKTTTQTYTTAKAPKTTTAVPSITTTSKKPPKTTTQTYTTAKAPKTTTDAPSITTATQKPKTTTQTFTTTKPTSSTAKPDLSCVPEGFECPASGISHFPNACDCTKYISCSHGKLTIESCPKPLVFNWWYRFCDNTGCPNLQDTTTEQPDKLKTTTPKQVTTTEQPDKFKSTTSKPVTETTTSTEKPIKPSGCNRGEKFVCPRRHGLFKDPCNCNGFYNCANGTPHAIRCNGGLLFNPVIKHCDWPRNVRCSN